MAIRKFTLTVATVALLATLVPGAHFLLFEPSVARAQIVPTCDELYQDRMVGYWTFNYTNDLMAPYIGMHRGTMVGPVTSNAGQVGRALELNGGAYVDYGIGLDVPAWDSYTVSIWFLNDGRVPWVKGYGQKIIDKTTWYSDFFLGVQDQSDPALPANLVFMYDTGFKNIQTGGYGYNDSQWHHAVITKSGVHGELWVDGVLIGAKDDVNPTINNQPLLLGYSLSGDGYQRIYWGGLLDEFAVFNQALSVEEIGALYQRSSNGQPYCMQDHFVVTSTEPYIDGVCDPLSCTLFEAITAANGHPGHDTIAFNIPGPGPYLINHTQLTAVQGPITIDGYTQPGARPATTDDPAAMDAKPLIVLDGANIIVEGPRIEPPEGFSFCLDGTACLIQGLVFQNYRITPIRLGGNATLAGNFLGTDVTGTISRPNATFNPGAGTIARSGGHVIGNLFSGPGIMMYGGTIDLRNNRFGVGMDGSPLPVDYAIMHVPFAGYATVIGNYFAYPSTHTFSVAGGYIANNRLINAGGGIGCGMDFHARCVIEDNVLTDSGGIGIFLSNGSAVRRNIITGSRGSGISVNGRETLSLEPNPTMIIEDNLIAHNSGDGIVEFGYYWTPSEGYANVFMTVRNNRIFDNGGLGIDLSAVDFRGDGVTLNDPGDLDTSGNSLQNFPVLAHAGGNPNNTVIQGALSTSGDDTFILDFYANSECDPSGYGEGERYLGQASVQTDANGEAHFTASLPVPSMQFERLTATATNSDGATSEFSQCMINAGIVNGYLAQESLTIDRSRLGEGLFTVHVTFRNQGDMALHNGFFKVTRLAYQVGEKEPAALVVQNALGEPMGTGALVAIPAVVEAGATFAVSFAISLPRIEPFNFFVDGYGVPAGELDAAVQERIAAQPTFDMSITDEGLAEHVNAIDVTQETIFLPLINR